MTITVEKRQNGYIVYKEPLKANDIEALFNPAYLKEQGYITGTAQGRGEAFFFTLPSGQQLILRHYYRGGLAAKWSKDSYLYLGLQQTRAYREFMMLDELHQQQLPVPEPFGCKITLHRGHYRANIITHTITKAETLAERAHKAPVEPSLWQGIGETIARFHKRGVYHHDLNANNILLTSSKDIYLIDFDKAAFKNPSNEQWQQQNIARLLRSLKKINQNQGLYFETEHWQALLAGYQAS